MRSLLAFGAVAALLLISGPAHGDPWKDESGHGRGRWNRGDDWRGGPPPWAPAWGYRANRSGLGGSASGWDDPSWRRPGYDPHFRPDFLSPSDRLRFDVDRRWHQRRRDLQESYNRYYGLPQGLPGYYDPYFGYDSSWRY